MASELWAELGPAQTAILADRLTALFSAPWIVQQAAAVPRTGRSPESRGLGYIRPRMRGMRSLGGLPAAGWDGLLALLDRAVGSPSHEVYARFAEAAPTLGWFVLDLLQPRRRLPPGTPRSRAEAYASQFSTDPPFEQREVVVDRLTSLFSTAWMVKRLALIEKDSTLSLDEIGKTRNDGWHA